MSIAIDELRRAADDVEALTTTILRNPMTDAAYAREDADTLRAVIRDLDGMLRSAATLAVRDRSVLAELDALKPRVVDVLTAAKAAATAIEAAQR